VAKNLNVGDRVYIPCAHLQGLPEQPSALYRTEVAEVGPRSIRVNLPAGAVSDWIGNGLAHKDVGILIVTIGDYQTELTLLDPLAKSVLQFCRLLVPDDQLRSLKVRSIAEFRRFWGDVQAAFSHVILIAHGRKNGIRFGDDWINPDELDNVLRVWGASPKLFISLGCQTGYQEFAGALSRQAICGSAIAPFQSVHGAVASQFCQSFLTSHFIEGKSIGVAFKKARTSVVGGASFRLWKSGGLEL
jgi:hypothetical protein